MDRIFKIAGAAHVACVGVMDSLGFHPPASLGSHLGLFGLIFAVAVVIAELIDVWRSWRKQQREEKEKEERRVEAKKRRTERKQGTPLD
jgi:hypothetical protein